MPDANADGELALMAVPNKVQLVATVAAMTEMQRKVLLRRFTRTTTSVPAPSSTAPASRSRPLPCHTIDARSLMRQASRVSSAHVSHCATHACRTDISSELPRCRIYAVQGRWWQCD